MLGLLPRSIIEINIAKNAHPNCKYIFEYQPKPHKSIVKTSKPSIGKRLINLFFSL